MIAPVLALALVVQDVPLKPDTTSLTSHVQRVRLPPSHEATAGHRSLGGGGRPELSDVQSDRDGVRLNDAQPADTLADIRVQGNVATGDDEMQRLAGVQIGMPVTSDLVDAVAARLRATRRFDRVEVRKRFASIADPSQIVLVIIVDEGPVKIVMTGNPDHPTRIVRRRRLGLLFLPVLGAEDGYGLTYGLRLAKPDLVGARSRVSFPLTWGGEKKAGVELDEPLGHAAAAARLLAGASISRRTNPFYRQDDDRGRVWIRVERALGPALRAGAAAGWQQVSFLGAEDSFAHAGVDVTLDTRLDPMLARNAVYARAAWEHVAVSGGRHRTELDARGYIGLIGQPVLMLRVVRSDADGPLPAYLRPLAGGTSNLRGFEAGFASGDTLVAGSAEVLVPLTSPLRVGKAGVSTFIDAGTVYDNGQRLADQRWHRGIGGSVWFSAGFARISLAVAHGAGASTRVHVGGTVSF